MKRDFESFVYLRVVVKFGGGIWRKEVRWEAEKAEKEARIEYVERRAESVVYINFKEKLKLIEIKPHLKTWNSKEKLLYDCVN